VGVGAREVREGDRGHNGRRGGGAGSGRAVKEETGARAEEVGEGGRRQREGPCGASKTRERHWWGS
jgi:hypothetical protein